MSFSNFWVKKTGFVVTWVTCSCAQFFLGHLLEEIFAFLNFQLPAQYFAYYRPVLLMGRIFGFYDVNSCLICNFGLFLSLLEDSLSNE